VDAPPIVRTGPAPQSKLFERSARGDKVAQGALAAEILLLGDQGHFRPLEAWGAVEVLARLAAVHGDPLDRRGLASVLFLRAEWEKQHGCPVRAVNFQAEGVQILDQLADEGDEDAAASLNLAGSIADPAAMQLARSEVRGVDW
jgi:hypothetical protein